MDPDYRFIFRESPAGIVPVQHDVPVNTVTRYIMSPSGIYAIAPNYRPFPHTASQSECEAYVNPNVPGKLIVGWNSYSPSFYGTGFAITTNGGSIWTGNYTLPGLAVNSGDPSNVINSTGNFFMNAIGSPSSRQWVSMSADAGVSWSAYVTAGTNTGSTSTADKNHFTIDDKSTSPYYNRQYIAWTDFGISSSIPPVVLTYSADNGATWTGSAAGTALHLTVPISGHFSQGVNLHTGPNGEVYFVCCTGISSNPWTGDYVGFGKSVNGGANWTVNESKIDMNGIRGSLKTTGIRCNDFPWMAVDKTGGTYNGYIYVVWNQKNLAPAGSDPDICFSKSMDGGNTFSAPIRINDDPINNGRDQWQPNICVDQYGGINIIFYDSRNGSINDTTETYIARSMDGGSTFTNILVSDHRFAPKPISGLAGGYQGDYIGIAALADRVYPFWADDYTGIYQVWTASIELGPAIKHTALSNTELTTGTRAVNAVITPLQGHPIDPTKTKLVYGKGSIYTDSLLMTNTGGNNWTANLTLSGAGTYKYYIRAIDDLGKVVTAPADAPGSFYQFTAASDITPPVIATIPLGNFPKSSWPATLTATVTDNIGVDSSWVRWYKNSTGTGIKQFKLINTTGSTFSAAFNSINSDVVLGDYIFYKIFAQDNSSNHNRDSSALYNFKIVPLSVCEDFSGGVVPPAGWAVSGTYWTYNLVSGYGTGTGSAKFDYYSATSGNNEYLTSLTFDPSLAGDSIKFDLAQAFYSASYVDSLIVEASTDGGASYTALARMYSGTTYTATLCMSTVSTTSLFTPTSAQWKSRAFALPTGTNKVHFYAKSGYGNNLFIDNVCKSSPTLSLGLTAMLSGYCNGTTMNYTKNVTVELHNSTTPYALVESQSVPLNSSGVGNPVYTTALNGTPYYIVLKFDNGLETWSATPQTFSGSALNYIFTDLATKAYGSNMIQVGTVWCIISGDADQDGSVGALDRSACWNDRNLVGVYVTDLDGDGSVGALDRSICWNNRNLAVQKPALAANPKNELNKDKKEDKGKYDLKLDGSNAKKVIKTK